MRSTLDPLTNLDADIGNAFAANEYVTAVFFDLEKAYDTTWRYHILEKMYSAKLRGRLPIANEFFLSEIRFVMLWKWCLIGICWNYQLLLE